MMGVGGAFWTDNAALEVKNRSAYAGLEAYKLAGGVIKYTLKRTYPSQGCHGVLNLVELKGIEPAGCYKLIARSSTKKYVQTDSLRSSIDDANQIRADRDDADPIPCAPLDTDIREVRRAVKHSREKRH